MKNTLLSIAIVLAFAGCSSSGVVQMDKNTYMVSIQRPKIGFTTADGEKSDCYKKANAFAAKRGMAIETIKVDSNGSGLARSARASLEFKLVPKQ